MTFVIRTLLMRFRVPVLGSQNLNWNINGEYIAMGPFNGGYNYVV